MGTTYLCNAFSLSMIALDDGPVNVAVRPVSATAAAGILRQGGFISAVGHADAAAQIGAALNLLTPMNRVSIKLTPGDLLVVAQYTGPRLPEGTTVLPEGAGFTFLLVNPFRIPFKNEE